MRTLCLFNCIYITIFFLIDAICAAVFQLVQTLLPNGKQKISGDLSNKRTQRNFSKKDSQEAFIVVCETETIYQEYSNAKVTKDLSVPPYITIIGNLLEPKSVLCNFANITYKMYSLPRAIDICFKIYHLFSIKYSPAARLMWQFINKQFYGIKDANTYPAVHVLIKIINGNLTNIYLF